MRFVKMHGLQNDFVVADLRGEQAPLAERADWPALAEAICHRRTGVGADGVLLVLPSQQADVRMRVLNADGSEAESCGNGIRCVARYVWEQDGATTPAVTVETLGGVVTVRPRPGTRFEVDMGPPRLHPTEVPALAPGDLALEQPLGVDGERLTLALVSMGNPHAVAFLDGRSVADYPLDRIGPQVEWHPLFPKRTNFEVVERQAPNRVRVRVWERGAGETMACGTGACAVLVAGVLRNLLTSPATVELPGGALEIAWSPGGSVFMTGPAEYVFTGTWPR